MLMTLLTLALASQVAEPPLASPPVLTLSLVRPQDQLAGILSLFEGTKSPSPASALALWKQAKPGRALTKAAEAGIAILNPEMVGELKSLDGARLILRLNEAGRADWWASLPGDDGTFSAIATAMVLTDGAQLDALGGQPIDRIGPVGAPLMARAEGGKGAVLASSREELARTHQPPQKPEIPSGFVASLDPEGLTSAGNLNLRRAGEALRGVGCKGVRSVGVLGSEGLSVSVAGLYETPTLLKGARIDPRWLDAVPSRRLLAAWAFAIEPSAAFWDSTFALADRIEKVDPTRAGLAPLRLRLAFLTAAAKIRPEAELLPYLRGVTGHLSADAQGAVASGVLCLQVDSPARARSLAAEFIPRLATLGSLGTPVLQPDGRQTWSGRKPLGVIECEAVGSSLWIGWGTDALREAKAAQRDAAGARPVIDPANLANCQRFALIKPRLMTNRDSSVSEVVWKGEVHEKSTKDLILWTGLKAEVRNVLEQLLPSPPSVPR